VFDVVRSLFLSFIFLFYYDRILLQNRGVYVSTLTGQTLTLVEALQKNCIMGQLVNKTADKDSPWGLIQASGRNEMMSVYSPLSDSFIPAVQAVQLGLLSEVCRTRLMLFISF